MLAVGENTRAEIVSRPASSGMVVGRLTTARAKTWPPERRTFSALPLPPAGPASTTLPSPPSKPAIGGETVSKFASTVPVGVGGGGGGAAA